MSSNWTSPPTVVLVAGEEVHLTRTEFNLLKTLMETAAAC